MAGDARLRAGVAVQLRHQMLCGLHQALSCVNGETMIPGSSSHLHVLWCLRRCPLAAHPFSLWLVARRKGEKWQVGASGGATHVQVVRGGPGGQTRLGAAWAAPRVWRVPKERPLCSLWWQRD